MQGRVQAQPTARVLLTLVVVIAVLRQAQEVFVPLALAMLLTFLLAPLVAWLRMAGIRRLPAVLLSMLLALLCAGGLADFVFTQLGELARQLPHYQTQLHENLTHLRGALRHGVTETTRAVQELGREIQRVSPVPPVDGVTKVQVVRGPSTALDILRDFVGLLIKPFGTALVVLVLVGFMLLRLPDLRERFIRLLGPRNLHATTQALSDAAGRVSTYLLFQLLVNCWTGLAFAVGLWALDVPNPGLWGALVALLRFVPYVGVWIGSAMPFLLSFAVFDDLTRPLVVAVLMGALELLNFVVLEPWLYGHRTGISPVALLLSAAFWAWLWGGVGLLLAVPLTVCLVVMGRYVPQLAFLEVLLGDEPVLEPHQRLYQRLLASDHDEAEVLLQSQLRERSLVEVADQSILPAMRLAEDDFERGVLEGAQRELVLQHIATWIEERLESEPTAPTDASAPILCLPGATAADRVSARLLEAALCERGLRALSAEPEHLRRALEPMPLVVICVLPPEAITRGRALCRRVRQGRPEAHVIVALWHFESDLHHARERLVAAGAGRVVLSLAQAVEACLAAHGPVTSANAAAAAAPGVGPGALTAT